MPKVKISEYSATANSNTDVASINIDEGCAPSGINNAIRAIMGHLKDFQSGTSNDPFTVGSSGSLTLSYGTANGVAYLNGSKVLTTGSALVFDGSNLGLGVTPPTSTDAGNITIKGGSTLNFSTASANIASNATFNSGWKYIATAAAVKYTQSGAEHQWFNAASGTAGNAITFTQAMTLDASGKLLLGVTSGAGLSNGDFAMGNGNHIRFRNAANSAYISAFEFTSANGLNIGTGGSLSTITFGISGIGEAGRFDASGNLLVGDTSVIGSGKLSIKSDAAIATKGATATNFGSWTMHRADTGAKVWEITGDHTTWYLADADFTNYVYLQQNFTAWTFASDRRIKTDIADIEYGLDAVMAMKPRKYKMIASGLPSIGFIAQELQTVIPEAVEGEEIEYLDTDTPQEKAAKTMGVSKDTLIPVLVKAIQELKAEFDAYKASHP